MLLLPAVASAQETQKINKKILDHVTTYSPDGKKVEEIEYGEKGQKWRKRYEYDENGKMSREIVYDENNALVNYSTALMLPLHCLTCNRSRYNSECCKYTYSTTRISIVMRRYIECYQLLFWLALIKVVPSVPGSKDRPCQQTHCARER